MNYVLIIFIAAIGVFYYNTLGWLVNSWMNNEYYFHDLSSLLMFSVALLGLFFVGRCFGRLQFKKIF